MLRHAIGIDLGGTKIGFGIVDENGIVIHQIRVDTLVDQGPYAVQNQLLEGILSLKKQFSSPLVGIGIGLAGQIDPESEEVLFAPNLRWHHFPLKINLEKELKCPIRLINDVRAITLGEWLFGAETKCQNLVCLFVGTGVGGGVISDGHLQKGHTNTFGEIGHMIIDLNGPLCTCGSKGCLEAIVGGWAIAKQAQHLIILHRNSFAAKFLLELVEGQVDRVSAKTVFEAYLKGNEISEEVVRSVQKALIAGCTNLVNIFNPERLILGGGVIEGMPELIESVKKGLHQFALKAALPSLEVAKSNLGPSSGIIGAAAAILNSFNIDKIS